ncbi:hypothetical protein ACJX0J_016558, partial [Zea mays]
EKHVFLQTKDSQAGTDFEKTEKQGLVAQIMMMINTPQEEVDDKREDANEKKGKQKLDSDAQKWIEDGILDEGNDIDWIKPILARCYQWGKNDCFDVREQE